MIDRPAQITQGQVAERQAAGKQTAGAAPLALRPDATMSISRQSDAATEWTPGTALAQLSALRNLAMAAAANGDAMGLRQLAERAAAIGVAAGAEAESLSGEIAARLATATQNQDGGARSTAGTTSDNPSMLGLDPAVITQALAASPPDDPASGNPAASQAPGAATDLNLIASLNYRASSVIAEARSLLASMNAAFKDSNAVRGTSPAAGSSAGSQQAVTLNGLAGLLDQAESSLTAHMLSLGRQLGNPAVSPAGHPGMPSTASSATATLDLST